MKMTPTTVVVGSLLILAAVVFAVVILPYADTSRTVASDIFRHAVGGRSRRPGHLHRQRLCLLPQPVDPGRRLGPGGGTHRPGRRLHQGPADSPRLPAHRPRPFPGRRRTPGRLAPGPLRQPALHPAPVDHAGVRVSRAGSNPTP